MFRANYFYNNDGMKESLDFTSIGFLIFGVSWCGSSGGNTVSGIVLDFDNERSCSPLFFESDSTN